MAAPPSRRASPPELPEELVEEILLRLPPDDPGCLLRASLVCKTWSSAISHPGFRRRFHDHHRTAPVLGFLHDWDDERISHFVPTTASSFSLAAPDWRSWRAIDCRHGRALFLSKGPGAWELLLWEPDTGAQRRVPVPAAFESEYPTAAVICAADGCDHRDCLGGPFRLVFIFAAIFDIHFTPMEELVTSVCVYSSETGTWGEPTSLYREVGNFTQYSSILVGNSLLYFMSDGEAIQEYDLARHSLTVFDAPDNSFEQKFNLMLAENGELGVSESMNQRLNLWSRESNGGTGAGWVLSRVIYFEIVLRNTALVDSVYVLGFAEGANAIFVSTIAGVFMIELQSDRARKVCDDHGFCNLIPVVAFYTPLPRNEQHNLPPSSPCEEAGGEDGGDLDKTFDQAQHLFDKGSNAIKEGDFVNAFECVSHDLKIRVPCYGEGALDNKHGCALKRKESSGDLANSALDVELVKGTSSKDTGNSTSSDSNVEGAPPSEKESK